MWEDIKKRFTGDHLFFWIAIVLITYVNHTYFDKYINIILFILPIMVMDLIEYGFKKPPKYSKYPKYLLTILITVLYMFSMPKYSTAYAKNFMEDNYGKDVYLLTYTVDQIKSFNPFSKEIYYTFLNADDKEYLFNARTGEVKESNTDVDTK